jgi:hypothetical protein
MPLRVPLPYPLGQSRSTANACSIVRDHGEQALACVYFEDEPGDDLRPTRCANIFRFRGALFRAGSVMHEAIFRTLCGHKIAPQN